MDHAQPDHVDFHDPALSTGSGRHQHASRSSTAYAPLLGLYAAAVAISTSGLVATGRRLPERRDLVDVALIGVAAHTISRLVATSPIARPLRPTSDTAARPVRSAVADTLSCPDCLMLWAATGITFAAHQAPRQTRLAVRLLVSLTAAELLHDVRRRLDALS